MQYIIEDTPTGFRISIMPSGRQERHSYDEPNGHGPIERLYVQAQETWESERAQQLAREGMGR